MIDRPFPVLRTERLVLRQPAAGDARALLEVFRDEEVMRYYGMEPLETEEQVLDELDWCNQIFSDSSGIRWAIADPARDAYMGDLGYHKVALEHARAEVGYRLARAHWRQGIMAEALSAALAYGYETMGLNRVEALVDPRNEASLGLLRKLGFVREGVLREYEYEKGAFIDLIMMSLLRKEWRP